VPFLAEKCGVLLDGAETAVAHHEQAEIHLPEASAKALDDLSQADVEALLAEELSEIDELLKGF
jgi:hypothetical protein